MKQRNWLWSLVVLVLLLLAYYLGTRGEPIGEQPPPALSTIAFSDPQPDDSRFPDKVVFVSEGTYTNAELNQEFPVTVVGNSAEAVKAYTDSTKFFFEAKASVNPPGEIAPTPTPEPDFQSEFSTLDMLNTNADGLWIEFELADENAKSFEDAKQGYTLNFIIDPTINASAKYHNYSTKKNIKYASVTLTVTSTPDNIRGAAKASLYRKISATQSGCTRVAYITVYESASSKISNTATFPASYDTVIQGITMPVTYRLSGTWLYDSPTASSSTALSCP